MSFRGARTTPVAILAAPHHVAFVVPPKCESDHVTRVRKTLTKNQHISDGQWLLTVTHSHLWDTTKRDHRATGTGLRPSSRKTRSLPPYTETTAGCPHHSMTRVLPPTPSARARRKSHSCRGLTLTPHTRTGVGQPMRSSFNAGVSNGLRPPIMPLKRQE